MWSQHEEKYVQKLVLFDAWPKIPQLEKLSSFPPFSSASGNSVNFLSFITQSNNISYLLQLWLPWWVNPTPRLLG